MGEGLSHWSSMVLRKSQTCFSDRHTHPNSMYSNFCHVLKEFIKKQESYKYYSSYEFEIIILLLFYYGKVDKAEKELENALSIISRWDNSTWLIRFLGVKGWERKMRNLMNKDTLQENINKEIVKYKLEEFIDYRLIDNK